MDDDACEQDELNDANQQVACHEFGVLFKGLAAIQFVQQQVSVQVFEEVQDQKQTC